MSLEYAGLCRRDRSRQHAFDALSNRCQGTLDFAFFPFWVFRALVVQRLGKAHAADDHGFAFSDAGADRDAAVVRNRNMRKRSGQSDGLAVLIGRA